MRLSMLIVTIFAIVVAVLSFFLCEVIATGTVNRLYLSEESRTERELDYARELQKYVNDNKLSSDDVKKLADWAKDNKYLYIMVHKDDQLLFESGMYEEPEKDENDPNAPTDPDNPTDTGNPDTEGTGNPGGAENPDGTGGATDSGGTENPDGTDGTTDAEEGKGEDKNDGSDSIGSGITVNLPSREELMEYAREKEAYLITMSDASVLVSMADYIEYFYYDVINIASLVVAVIVLVVIILLYSHGITNRIYNLAKDVTVVADGDMEHPIRRDGEDEIGRLSRDVENMRSKMLENLANERAAMDANAELVTSMSHDIRTPLTVLLGYLDIMKDKSSYEEIREYIAASEKTALRLKKLSDDMFNYFLLFGGGAAEVNIEEYDAYTLFEQMLSEHVLLMREQEYNVLLTMDGELSSCGALTVKTDANKLMRIIENVVSNIMKYADKSAPVSIFARLEQGKLRLTFHNFISAELDDVESSGIGLKTCHKLSEAIGVGFETVEEGNEFSATITMLIYNREDKT